MHDGEECSGCGHSRHAHEHHRAGLDCSQCGCPGFTRRRWWQRKRRTRHIAAPLPFVRRLHTGPVHPLPPSQRPPAPRRKSS
ncbi:hypothetical protein GII30_04060 [Gordonia amarae]|uniref:Uncharacterized protein n=1 Tax=Gordonia amarae TaxID=36821 RepID=A0A857M7W0_9ACTN|nr:hypothetical protein [Gordonia amarae]MCS3877541.1 hypothetical protein [Gordonia amarae]QHN16267.1 hypothetical protein GII35_04065 [Gordonia amarae]QHN20836.1 hypothetical protein GII34_04065 [Gordonia amarae]QHN29687.1 hypothetical protein GII32_04070 [Gordonia amarae]QHN38463.1 hypothetical protein GII30_04060 [Gordonia amarae]